MNVLGVKELIKLCRGLKKLEVRLLYTWKVMPQNYLISQSLVHISTAFAHCNRTEIIEEVIYPLKVHPDKLIDLLE